jgi:hypothetical protein
MKLYEKGGHIEGNGVSIKAEYPVIAAALIQQHVVVIYDWMSFDQAAPARNLFCYTKEGKLLWRAADIGMGATDAYTSILSEEPLWVGNFAGYRCRISESNGIVLSQEFTK